MDVNERFSLIKTVGEEIITEDDLKLLLQEKKHPIAYDGFEPSGKLHIGQGLLRVININKMLKADCKFKIWVADWFAWMNNKYGGDMDKIHTAGEYFIEVWKACGLDMENVEVLWAKEAMKDENYWKTVVNIARNTTLARAERCTQIMGRESSESMPAAYVFYPCMQCADIFYLKVDIAQLGMDQRKVNMLAREVGPKIDFWKPVAVHHHMLMGLQQPPATKTKNDIQEYMLTSNAPVRLEDGSQLILRSFPPKEKIGGVNEIASKFTAITVGRDTHRIVLEHSNLKGIITPLSLTETGYINYPQLGLGIEIISVDKLNYAVRLKVELHASTIEKAIAMKMSKSKPETAIFMADSEEDVKRKIGNAYCPAKQAEENPVLEYAKYIIFERYKSMDIKRPAKFGGDLTFNSYHEIETAFAEGKLHPMDLKNSVSFYINELLNPVRKHFEKGKAAKLLEEVKSFEVTR